MVEGGGATHGKLSNYIIRLLDNHAMYVNVFWGGGRIGWGGYLTPNIRLLCYFVFKVSQCKVFK